MAGGSGDRAEFIYPQFQPAPFQQSKVYTVAGRRTSEGCVYADEALDVPAGVDRWQIRDLAIDPKRCIKLVEEGIPTEDELPADGYSSLVQSIAAEPDKTGAEGGVGIASVASGYAHAWFVDGPGYMVTSDTTYISWIYSGGCVTSGNASVGWEWRSGTGWRLVSGSNGATANQTCSRYFAVSWATMTNSSFVLCPWATFKTYYYHVRAYGWSDGHGTGSRTTYLVEDDSCPLHLYGRFEWVQTG